VFCQRAIQRPAKGCLQHAHKPFADHV
jgi:hypothetical protein